MSLKGYSAAALCQFLVSGSRKADGSINAAGVVKFYDNDQAYTTTQVVYTAADKTGAIVELTLDANGTGVVYGDGIYDVKIFESDGITLVETLDNVALIRDDLSTENTLYVTGTNSIDLATYTPAFYDLVVVNTTSSIAITLPPASAYSGRHMAFKTIHATTGTITLTAAGAETIDGAATQTLTARYQSRTLYAFLETATGYWYQQNPVHDHSSGAGGNTLNSPILVTPTIASYVNATHDHADAAGGGFAIRRVGQTVQEVHVQDGEVATGNTALPFDDTIPQITEGDEYMTLSVTPTSATNKLRITSRFNYSTTAVKEAIMALFKDATVDALTASVSSSSTAADMKSMALEYEMLAGTTDPITFRIRAGIDGGVTITFNGASSARKLGGVFSSNITIEEIQI